MPSVQAVVTEPFGDERGKTLFSVISDGTNTKFIFPDGTPDPVIEDILTAMGTRIRESTTTDPEELLDGLMYNYSGSLDSSDLYENFDDAMKDAQDDMFAVNGFEGENPSKTYDPIIVKLTEGE